ncbi:MAG: hypothetical protein E7E42_06775 [Veillonella sp.]|nr:hypothetical protein [Veillonella sp.]
MIRIINLRVAVTVKATIEEIVEKKYPQLKGHIQKIHVVRRAVDARKKPNIVFVYTLFVEAQHEERIIKKLGKQKDVTLFTPEDPEPIVIGDKPLAHRPVVMGFGPAGMMAAFYLAREGYRPIVLERGQDVDTRAKDVETFWKTGSFKPESNVQFGEGGAGTFSDGKLTTRVTHPRLHEISKYFVEFGAPEEILYKHKPHVGTDKLRHMVKAMRERIIEWGGEVRFDAKVTDVFVDQDRVVGIEVNGAERIDSTLVLSGVGHSARDTYEMLFKRGVDMVAKPFAIGVRIEHPQDVIDQSQYGVDPKSLGLGAAEYSLVYHDKESGRTAYSFCMCPGGQVVASASEPGGVVTNGMSLYARDSGVANSAIVVNVGPDDFGTHPLYEPHIVDCDLHQCLPDYVSSVLERALPYWGRRIKGFDNPEICMTGVETRTSSPLRMGRDENRVSTTVGGFYPMGEGAGYAGGIMSAALDGAETAIACMSMYARPNK